MAQLNIWFLDVGHGDSAYLELPNGARMMIDCGAGPDNWPSKMLKHYRITKRENPVPIPNRPNLYALDKLVISHPHGDHLSDIAAIHDDIGFRWLVGAYKDFIDEIDIGEIDFRKRGQEAGDKFKGIVKDYIGPYVPNEDRVNLARPVCVVESKRFLPYEKGMDLNELSWFVSIVIGSHKILFVGDMTASGVRKILGSSRAAEFREFVSGATILKVPHHGRENGCSTEMFAAFGRAPLLCVVSDKVLDDDNEGTADTAWYSQRASNENVEIDGQLQNRKVLTTRSDGDVYLKISDSSEISVNTHCFQNDREAILSN